MKKSSGTLYWRAQDGTLMAESDASGTITREYIYFAGRLIAYRDATASLHYMFQDHLGSTQTATTQTGVVCYDADHPPFGGEITYTNTCDQDYKFAGMEYDGESGDYSTLFRQYTPTLGRWTSPDPVAGEVADPLSLNRYAYVLNNPTNFTDPLGLDQYSDYRNGRVIGGYDIFDAISGAAGTWFNIDMYGNIQWGWDFPSIYEWKATATFNGKSYEQTFNTLDEAGHWLSGVRYLEEFKMDRTKAIQRQLDRTVRTIKATGQVKKQSVIDDFLERNADFSKLEVIGGNVNFLGADILGLKCEHKRCDMGKLGTLDFSHGDHTRIHLDTANPFNFFGGGTFLHAAVDVLGGTFVFSIIPR